MLKRLVIGLVLAALLFFGVSFALPQQYGFSRDIVVQAPAAVVFDQVQDLHKYKGWSPWSESDPSMKVTYGGKTTGRGATFSWTSDHSGNGTLTVAETVAARRIVNQLEFGRQGSAKAIWTFDDAGGPTEVVWAMEGVATNPIGRWMGLFIESMAGPAFERGLANLKKQAESATSTSTSTAERG